MFLIFFKDLNSHTHTHTQNSLKGIGIVAQPATLVSYMGDGACSRELLHFQSSSPVMHLGKAVEGGPSAWAPVTHTEDLDKAPCLGLAQL